ncbi:MAG TPA: Hpt domain-containing protein [Xanthobacteraceae bacterium]|nr:Hpt domain-containing protein [Xanthobacteraceae bacterium]
MTVSVRMSASDLLGNGSDNSHCVIDEAHLERMTLGDRALERDLLRIFVRQNATILDRITVRDLVAVAAAAHTMIGSARGIGAWRVAKAAEQLARAADEGDETDVGEAIAALKSASLEVNVAIDARLADPSHPISDCA